MKGRKPLSHVRQAQMWSQTILRLRKLFTKQIARATIANLVANYRKICDVPFDVANTCLQSH